MRHLDAHIAVYPKSDTHPDYTKCELIAAAYSRPYFVKKKGKKDDDAGILAGALDQLGVLLRAGVIPTKMVLNMHIGF